MFSDHPNDWLLDVSEYFSYLLSPAELFHMLSFMNDFVNVVFKRNDETEMTNTHTHRPFLKFGYKIIT